MEAQDENTLSTEELEIALEVCESVEVTPRGLEHICKEHGKITARTFHRWLERSEELRQRYARAKEMQADLIAFQVLEIADTPVVGVRTKTTLTGTEVTEGDMIEHRRLQVDARKWAAGKLSPKKYGDKVDLTSGGERIAAPVVTFQSHPDA